MLTPQRQPAGVEPIPSAFGTRVPPVIESFIHVMIKQARDQAHMLMEDAAEQALLDKLEIQKVSREVFRQYTVEKEVSPPQVKPCRITDRVYLSGTGKPGRTTYRQKELPVPEHTLDEDIQDRVRSKVVTSEEEEESLLLAFSEVTWSEFRAATALYEELSNAAIHLFTDFFDVSPNQCPNLILATGFGRQEIMRIARSVRHHKGR